MPTTAEQQFADKVHELKAMQKVPAEYLHRYYNVAAGLLSGQQTAALALKAANDLATSVDLIQQYAREMNNAVVRGLLEGPAVEIFNANKSRAAAFATLQ